MPDDPVKIDLENPEVKKLVDEAVKAAVTAAVAEATTGLTTNRDAILGEKKELQKKLDEQNAQWDGLDPEVVKNLVNRMNTDEETKLIAEGKIDEVLERRTSAMKTDLQTKLTAALEKVAELEETGAGHVNKVKGLVMDGKIRQAGGELKILPTAVEDAIVRANSVFSLDDEDNPVARDSAGTLQMGKDGKTPLSPHEWLDGMREGAPHWFPAPEGAGAGGGGGPSQKSNFVLTRSQARDPSLYRQTKEAATKAGQQMQIVDDAAAA